MKNSNIEWTETTWNPVTGCTKISKGCKNCYAERMAKRLKAMDNIRYKKGFEPNMHYDILERPLNWKKPKKIFVNSMSDLYHKQVPDDFIKKVFDTMNKASWHIFQILTKRTNRLAKLSSSLNWKENIWQGVTVESEEYLHRIQDLKKVPAKIKFISFEPLLGEIDTNKLNLSHIDWVIVGGESGPGARPMKKEWVLKLRNKCIENNIAFFFKQWGGVNRKANGRTLKGQTWNQYPDEIKLLGKNLKKYQK